MDPHGDGPDSLLWRAWKAIAKAFTSSRLPGETQMDGGADTTLFDTLRDEATGKSGRPPASEWEGGGESSLFDPNPRRKNARR